MEKILDTGVFKFLCFRKMEYTDVIVAVKNESWIVAYVNFTMQIISNNINVHKMLLFQHNTIGFGIYLINIERKLSQYLYENGNWLKIDIDQKLLLLNI